MELVLNDEKISVHEILLMLMDKRVGVPEKIQTVDRAIVGPRVLGAFRVSTRLGQQAV